VGKQIPIISVATDGEYTSVKARETKKLGIPMNPSPERLLKAAYALVAYSRWLKKQGAYEQFLREVLLRTT